MSIGSSISGAFKGASSRRILFLGVVVVVGAGAYFAFARNDPPTNRVQVRPLPSSIETTQGKVAVTPAMDQALSVDDQRRHDAAEKSGGSSIPTIRAAETRNVNLGDPDNGEADELDVPKRPEPPVIQRPPVSAPPVMPITPVAAPGQPDPAVFEFRQALGQFEKKAYPEALVKTFADMKYFEKKADEEAYSSGSVDGASLGQANAFPVQLPLPGTVLYAEMISEANSDAPGPVLAQIVEGPLAGARLIGRFQVARDNLVIVFSTLSMGRTRDGDEVNASTPISAFAVDTKNIGTALATSRDYHVLQNVGLTFAAAFAQGFGQALSQSGQQIVSGGDGSYLVTNPALSTKEQLFVAGGAAAGATGQVLNQMFGNRPVTVKVASGTPLGILFMPKDTGGY